MLAPVCGKREKEVSLLDGISSKYVSAELLPTRPTNGHRVAPGLGGVASERRALPALHTVPARSPAARTVARAVECSCAPFCMRRAHPQHPYASA